MHDAAGSEKAVGRARRGHVRHRAQRRRDAPGRDRPARRPPGRHPEHQDPRRGARRRRQAWKQKGTGRARQGSIRSPQWQGGGVALGPKPRSYAQRTPKKMIRLALRSALSDRAAEGKVLVVDEWGFEAPSTKDAVAALGRPGLEGRASWSCSTRRRRRHRQELPQPARGARCSSRGELNAYDVLVQRLWSCSPRTPCRRRGADAADDEPPATPHVAARRPSRRRQPARGGSGERRTPRRGRRR